MRKALMIGALLLLLAAAIWIAVKAGGSRVQAQSAVEAADGLLNQ